MTAVGERFAGQLVALVQAKTVNGSTTTGQYAYTLDSAGNLKQVGVSGSALTASTTSDAYNPANQICWSYAGASSNACGTVPTGGHSYTYDADGNQTSNGNGTTQTYNALQQMTSMTVAGTATNYSYLGEGQNELTADGTTTLHNDLLGLASTTTSGSSTYFTRTPSGNQIDERTPGGTTYDYLYDPQGSVIGLAYATGGHLAKQYSYTPYGTQTVVSGTVANPFGFQDGYQTADGLYHYGARYQTPGDARWTQQDPLNQASNLTQDDRYVFAGMDPINLKDPLGKDYVGNVTNGVALGGGAGATAGCVIGAIAAGGIGCGPGAAIGAGLGAAAGFVGGTIDTIANLL